jgi:excisionase family DNA binding protein
MELQALLTAQDVARILGISRRTVHRLVRERKLSCIQVTSKERRFSESQVADYIQSQSAPRLVDMNAARRLSSHRTKGGEKSIGVSGTDLRKEMRSW